MPRKRDEGVAGTRQPVRGMAMNSALFERLAEKAIVASRTDPNEALVAIVMSVATLEAFLSEMVAYASDFPGLPRSPQTNALAALLNEDSIQRVPLVTRLHLAHIAFNGQPLPRGDSVYQDLERLITLRDNIAHPKADWSKPIDASSVEGLAGRSLQRVVSELGVRGLVHALPPVASTALIPAICTSGVAEWALRTVRGVRDTILTAGAETSAAAGAYRSTHEWSLRVREWQSQSSSGAALNERRVQPEPLERRQDGP